MHFTQCLNPKTRSLMMKKSKIVLQKNLMSDLVIKKVNLLVFMTMLWLFNANWCFQKNLVPNWLEGGLIHSNVFSTFWVYSEFIETYWHIGTSLVDHTGFNGGRFGLECWAKFVCFSGLCCEKNILIFYEQCLVSYLLKLKVMTTKTQTNTDVNVEMYF